MGTALRDRRDERGFTLVELLVVILIIGLLAAIALPTFLNQRAKAQDGEAKWMAGVTAQALHVWHQDHDTFAGATPESLAEIEPSIAGAREISITGLTSDDFTVSIASAAGVNGGGPFIFEQRGSITERTCTAPGRGACPDDGLW
jgi:type IV pilus assembly protein PilA